VARAQAGNGERVEVGADSEDRRISMAMKQKTARTMKSAKAARKAESTVSMAADKTIRKESTAR